MALRDNHRHDVQKHPELSTARSHGEGVPSNSVLFVFGLISAATSTMGLLTGLILFLSQVIWTEAHLRVPDQNVLGSHPGRVSPIGCHSHNDYWRQSPLHSALSVGCISVEADVYAYNNELFVSHDMGGMVSTNTLTTMYLGPLLSMLDTKNALQNTTEFWHGIYDEDPKQTLVLLVDLKSNATVAWPLLLQKLENLRSRGWLSHVENGRFIPRPITVVGTGNTTLNMVKEENKLQDVFLDAPLDQLDGDSYDASNSYYASCSFRKSIGKVATKGLKKSQLLKLRGQIREAHERGLKVRYWGLPAWPLYKRDQTWKRLLDEGVDVLNVDDLEAAKREYAHRRALTAKAANL